jgi:FkbM family methyltransferase
MFRNAVMGALDRTGLGDIARRAKAATQPEWRKRNARDDENLLRLLRLTLPRDAACVDVGANVGAILTVMVEAAPDGTHTAFEPVPWLAEDLRACFPQVTVYESAVSDVAGETSFAVVRDRPSLSGLAATLPVGEAREAAEIVTVATVRLDDVLDAPPHLLKIDVEGGELGALRGAQGVLEGVRMVAFEFGHGLGPVDDERSEAVFAELDQVGLRIFDMDGQALPWPEFQRVYRDGSRWNFLAHR